MIGVPLEPVNYTAIANCAFYRFHSTKQNVDPISKWLVTTLMFMPLLIVSMNVSFQAKHHFSSKG